MRINWIEGSPYMAPSFFKKKVRPVNENDSLKKISAENFFQKEKNSQTIMK